MSGLKMPGKGKAAQLLSELNAEHAPAQAPDGTEQSESEATNVTTLQTSNEATPEPMGEMSAGPETGTVGGQADRQEKPARKPRAAPPAASASEGRDDRLARALQLAAEDEIAVVTVRVSARLNEYMDRYVERINRVAPKRRYRKQDAVAEAFAAFFADHPLPPAPADEEL